MATSIFDNKDQQPNEDDLKKVLKSKIDVWNHLFKILEDKYGIIKTEWKFYSKKAGWSLKVSNEKGKNLIFLLPNDNYFIATINMGVKIKEQVLQSDISDKNKKLIEESKIYTEGISTLFKITNKDDLEDMITILRIRDDC